MSWMKFFQRSSALALSVGLLGAAASADAQAIPAAGEPGPAPASTVGAQNPVDGQTGADANGIDDIVVTAEKRPNTEQKTAISMSVFSADVLAKNGVGNLADLTAIAPAVSFAQAGPATIVSVRGVSSRDTSEIGDPAVSISIDGFNLQRALGLNASLFDIERVEVLRGPQGTLLGRNATGGAINIVTARPGNALSGYVGAEVGNYGMYNFKGAVNLPVNDWIKIRAAFQTRDRNGYRNNGPSKNADDEHSQAGRLHLLLTPTSRLSVLLTAEYARQDQVGTATQAIPWKLYTAANVPAGLLVGDVDYTSVPNRGDGKTFPLPPGSFLKSESINIRGEINYDFGPAILTYQGGYRKFDISRLTTLGGVYGTQRQNFSFGQTESLPSWNHELRLSSNGTGPFRWQFGGFYFREDNDLVTRFLDFPEQASIGGTQFVLQDYQYPDISAEAKAAFGQIAYEFIPGLTAEAGARYSVDKKRRIGYNIVTNVTTYLTTRCYRTSSCAFVTTPQNSRTESEKTTYHAALNYQATPRNLLYAKFDTGYKAGGFTDLGEYKPESIEAYEIGSKNRFLDNMVQLNLSAYLYNYTDQQVSQTVTNAAGGVATLVQNAGKSRYKGIEIDAIFQPSPRDRFNAYVGYQDARYINFAATASGQITRIAASEGRLIGGNYQLAGRRPPQAPEWTVNVGYEHDFPILGGTLTPRVQTRLESETYFTFYNFRSDRQEGYTRTDLLMSFTPANKAFVLSGFVRNIEDSLILANAQAPFSSTYQSYREQYQAPRTYGASLTFNF